MPRKELQNVSWLGLFCIIYLFVVHHHHHSVQYWIWDFISSTSLKNKKRKRKYISSVEAVAAEAQEKKIYQENKRVSHRIWRIILKENKPIPYTYIKYFCALDHLLNITVIWDLCNSQNYYIYYCKYQLNITKYLVYFMLRNSS